MLRRARGPLIGAALLGLAAACVGPTFIVQQYGGPPRARETIAILRVVGREPVRLLYLDGEDVAAPITDDGRLHIEVLPARHTVTVADARAASARHPPLDFDARAGKVYRVVFVGDGARVFEVDRDSDRPLADVTAEPAPIVTPPRPVEDAGSVAVDAAAER